MIQKETQNLVIHCKMRTAGSIPFQFMENAIFAFYAFKLKLIIIKVCIGHNYCPNAHNVAVIKL